MKNEGFKPWKYGLKNKPSKIKVEGSQIIYTWNSKQPVVLMVVSNWMIQKITTYKKMGGFHQTSIH